MACLKRFELLTHALEGRCSIQLSYRYIFGAGNEGRTRDIQLGRLTLYQLSYSRNLSGRNSKIRTCGPLLPRQVRYRTALYSVLNKIDDTIKTGFLSIIFYIFFYYLYF